MEQANFHNYAVIRLVDVPEVQVEMLGAARRRVKGTWRSRCPVSAVSELMGAA